MLDIKKLTEVLKELDDEKDLDSQLPDIKPITEWTREYNENIDADTPEVLYNLASKGTVLLDNYYVLKSSISNMREHYEITLAHCKSDIMSAITPSTPAEKLSEALRERTVLLDATYQTKQIILGKLINLEKFVKDEGESFYRKLELLYSKIEYQKFIMNKLGGLEFLQKKTQEPKQKKVEDNKVENEVELTGVKNFKI